MRYVAIPLLVLQLSACALFQKSTSFVPATLGEEASAFGYVPLDGLAVGAYSDFTTCPFDTTRKVYAINYKPVLTALPDLSVRFAVARASVDGSLSFGPAKVTAAGGIYRAVLDYVNVDAVPVEFYLRRRIRSADGREGVRGILQRLADGESTTGYDARVGRAGNVYVDSATARQLQSLTDQEYDRVSIPVYIGIGMRLSADIRALKSGISLSSLGTIAAAAQADGLSGTLAVQTLGVTGQSIATALPLPSKLDQTTVENGILALGSSRAVIYIPADSASGVTITPRIVGLYSPVESDSRLINAIYAELSREPIPWRRECASQPAAAR